MSFSKIIKPYVRIFYALGLSPYHVEAETSTRKCIRSDVIPLLWFGFCLFLAISFLSENIRPPQQRNIHKVDVLWTDLDAIFEVIRGATVLAQCLFYKQYFYDISSSFNIIDYHFRIRFQHRVPYRSFKLYFRLKALLICGAYLQFFIGHILQLLKCSQGYDITKRLRALQGLTVLTFIYVILYIDVLSIHMEQLNVVVEKNMLPPNGFTSLTINNQLRFYKKLKSVKFIYFRLWDVTQKINKAFGWIFIALSSYGFFDLAVCAFCFYKGINSSNSQLIFSKFDATYLNLSLRTYLNS